MVTTLKRAWQRLTRATPGKTQAELAAKYTRFQALLSANNQVLTLMADMEEKLSGDYLFDLQYIRATVNQLRQHVNLMVEALNALGRHRYQALSQTWARLSAELAEVLEPRCEIPAAPLVLFFDQLDAQTVGIVGQRNARLGEAQTLLKLPVPPGFAISIYAYKVFLDYNRLTKRIAELLQQRRLEDLESLQRTSNEIRDMILAAPVPPELQKAMHEAYEGLADLTQQKPLIALRPSLVGEELAFTFADRYDSYLNLPASLMESRYKLILASLFPPRAVFYYNNKGFKEEDLACGVTVMPMIQAKASGILFTHHPHRSTPEAALVLAGWGVSKGVAPDAGDLDRYLVAYQPRGRLEESVIADKPKLWVCRPDAGLEEVPVHRDYLQAPCLQDRHLGQLLAWAESLEDHYHQAQKVEWAMDWQERLWCLTCHPLQVTHPKVGPPTSRTPKQGAVLLDQGIVAYRGVASGPVVLIQTKEDLATFPEGGVLVAKHTSPSYVQVMPKAAAILTDTGSPTGHMALLAREFQVPTILDTGVATRVLQAGQVVTVDANYGNVYDGLIPELLKPRDQGNGLGNSQIFQTLKVAVKKVVPLNLINPRDKASFKPDNCRTLHDIIRYTHEFSMREMFNLTEDEFLTDKKAVDLEAAPPFEVRILDLGGGLKKGWGRKVKPEQIISLPFRAFWQGFSEMHRRQEGSEGGAAAIPGPDQSLVVLSENYMNFRTHLEHDLVTVEAYVSNQVNDNYLAFGF